MKINIHAGHNPDGKVACGAIGIIKESTEARKVVAELINLLTLAGHKVYDCTCNDGKNSTNVLGKIIVKCNSHKVDLDVSIHFNAGAHNMEGNGFTTGTEVLIFSKNGGAYEYADRICKSISELGFKNRGVKERPDLYVLQKTKAPALLVECCFVDDADDVRLYDPTNMARAIANGILGKNVSAITESDPKPIPEFRIRTKVNELNIRQGPGVDYPIVGTAKKGVYTIVKTASNGKWGLLKSYGAKENGWINISPLYANKI